MTARVGLCKYCGQGIHLNTVGPHKWYHDTYNGHCHLVELGRCLTIGCDCSDEPHPELCFTCRTPVDPQTDACWHGVNGNLLHNACPEVDDDDVPIVKTGKPEITHAYPHNIREEFAKAEQNVKWWSDVASGRVNCSDEPEGTTEGPTPVTPKHPDGIEWINITRWFSYPLGTVIECIRQAGYTGEDIEQLRKARKFLDFAIETAELRRELEK